MISNNKIAYFLKNLTNWYKKNHRKLPFRETKDPYKIWISEVMLQQTRVGAVINKIENKYSLFIKRFPDIKSLANANLNEIYELWAGLGYYNRAKNIHKTAQIIYNQFNGNFPDDYKILIQLPGIGDYTASAILSIAFEKPYAVLDGNVKRLIYRYFYNNFETYEEKDIKNLLQNLIKQNNIQPSILNQALMEYGALICIYKYPKCDQCIISKYCDVKNFSKEEKANLPPKKQVLKKDLKINIYIITKENKLLIQKNKYLFLKNHYFFPYKIENDSIKNNKIPLEIKESETKFIGKLTHNIMHYNILANIFLVPYTKNNFTIQIKNKTETKWISLEQTKQYLFSSFARKVLDIYQNYYSLF
ncbi:MAG: A/G-specific adenine glycosylase [Leptospiraceae bacterium]|nr:MAG: A/G-specific adenine glycosylase [Leptospiraceae bacterium]